MPGLLTTGQLSQYRQAIQNGGVDAVRQVYRELYGQGYNYAGWAYGVASGETITGQSALDYLSGSAMAGLGGPGCRNLTPEQIDKIRVDMADGYIKSLENIAGENGGVVNRDVKYQETRDFHNNAFRDNGLTLDNWTLNTNAIKLGAGPKGSPGAALGKVGAM